MELREYLGIARRHWLTIVALGAIGALIALAYSMIAPRTYTATAQDFVSLKGSNRAAVAGGSFFAQQRVKSYEAIVDSASVLAPVVDQLDLNTTAPRLAASVSASNPPQTVLLNVTVTDSDPQRAAAIANAVATRYGDVIELLETPIGGQPPVKVTQIRQAVPPTSPASPRTKVNVALGLLLGLGAGLAWALLRTRLDTTVRSTEDVAAACQTPVLGTVPVDEDPLSALSADSEAFRTIRTNLTYVDVDNPPKVIAVVSAQPGEGKTTLSTNLAIALGLADRSVCLVEADLRRPNAAERMGIDPGAGLTSVLVGELDLESALVPWRRGLVTLLPAGRIPPNPSELLGSDAFAEVLNRLRDRFDVVIVDAAPLLPIADGALVSSAADGALLVARYGRTTRAALSDARAALDRVEARALGVVLNAVPVERLTTSYGYGYAPLEETAAVDELLR